MSLAWTNRPSSCRSRFSRRIFSEYGSVATRSERRARACSRLKISTDSPASVHALLVAKRICAAHPANPIKSATPRESGESSRVLKSGESLRVARRRVKTIERSKRGAKESKSCSEESSESLDSATLGRLAPDSSDSSLTPSTTDSSTLWSQVFLTAFATSSTASAARPLAPGPPSFARTSPSARARLVGALRVGQQRQRLGRDALGGAVVLDELGHDAAPGNEVDHRHVVDQQKPPAKPVGQRRQAGRRPPSDGRATRPARSRCPTR